MQSETANDGLVQVCVLLNTCTSKRLLWLVQVSRLVPKYSLRLQTQVLHFH